MPKDWARIAVWEFGVEGARVRMPATSGVSAEEKFPMMDTIMAALGSAGLEWEGPASNDGEAARDWLRSKANSIEGGTSEVQRLIISRALLS